ncbi:hypothetical protein ACFFQW_48100 [Umezawaea endophytica]|uniref:Uncharacterized protein n=1 Tax=Umezawaea endophytica TaxID=1654476 RepID=A0A9X3AFA1_9PSEU|nr:hypothetical protein [Umezawaea endophytica]MCS7477991.1 hypothetical protein [Umezawaea endophytica]
MRNTSPDVDDESPPSGAPLIWLAVVLGIACAAAAISGVAMVMNSDGGAALEIGKLLMTLAVALAVGGVATVIIRVAEDARSTQVRIAEQARSESLRDNDLDRAEKAEWAELLRQVVEVDESLAAARQLILAHKTAKTYAEQYKSLLESRLTLRRVILDPLMANDTSKDLRAALRRMLDYLEALSSEYEREYLPVARQQRLDEECVTVLVRALAETTPADRSSSALSQLYDPTQAWKMLEDRSRFPVLNGLLQPSKYRDGEFTTSYNEAKTILESHCGIERKVSIAPIILGNVKPT